MVSITLSVSEEIRELMKKYPEMNWSGYVRKCLEEKAKKLALREQMLKELESEEEQQFINWSVKLQRASRSGRLDSLKKKGLIK